MARKKATVTIDAEGGRDKGKVFVIDEMPASQAEEWAIRTFLALAKSGADVPEDIAAAGLAGIAQLGIRAFGGLNFADAQPLLAEMMACVRIMPDAAKPQVVRALVDDDIEEVKTRLFLRSQVLELHTGFSVAAGLSPSTTPTAPSSNSSNTRTSRGPSRH